MSSGLGGFLGMMREGRTQAFGIVFGRGRPAAADLLEGRQVEMVVVIVREQDEVDARQVLELLLERHLGAVRGQRHRHASWALLP